MKHQTLTEHLQQLHEMLATDEIEISADDREQLKQAATDIQQALTRGEDGQEIGQLDRFVTQFQTEHPALSDLLRRIVDGLSGIGI